MSSSSTNIDYSAPLAREMRPGNWFTRAEAWLDDKGKAAWIAAMVLGFILFWPIGLALLAYMIWSKRMFSKHLCPPQGQHLLRRRPVLRQFGLRRLQGRHAAPPGRRAEAVRRLPGASA